LTGRESIKVALVGIPNVGKSLIFNRLTGGKAWVGNWPGVTVEKKIGKLRINGAEAEVVDLPGIYSLTAYSIDELIARNFIIEENPDVVVCIASAVNLERSLYLAISLLELGANVVLDLNMIDLAEKEGYKVDSARLGGLLGVPVIETIATTGYGIDKLKNAIRKALQEKGRNVRIVNYGREVEEAIEKLEKLIEELTPELTSKYPARWLAIKLLEGDSDVLSKVVKLPRGEAVVSHARSLKECLERKVGDLESYIIKRRYERVLEITKAVVRKVVAPAISLTDAIDSVLTHKVLGIPFALSILYLLFRFAFEVSTPFVDLIDVAINGYLHDLVIGITTLPEWLTSLLADGVIAGVGTVLTFLPVVAFFFLGFAVFEDVGYIARIAFLVDKLFSKFNLPGKTIIPLIIGFGCNVPGVMATRTIEDENDRKTAALIAPLASCNARLPVYLVIGAAVLGYSAGFAVLSMYALGILLALLMGFAFRRFLFRGLSSGFVMELPPYMKPNIGNVAMKTWERTKKFLFKAGTVIFLGAVVVWFLSVTGPTGYLGPDHIEESFAGIIGNWLSSTILKPLGWDWRASVALLFGFIAKEVVVGTFGVLYGVGEEEETVAHAIAEHHSFTPLTGYAYMAFVLIYIPCVATLAAIRGELGLKYAILALVYEIVLAYVVALIIVAGGHALGIA